MCKYSVSNPFNRCEFRSECLNFAPQPKRSMELSNILSISGKTGLFKLLSSNGSNVIVESLIDGKRFPVHAANKISGLEDISIYTYEEDVPLAEVFEKIKAKENGGPCIDHNSSADELQNYMGEILPDFDEDRVYKSDLKKLFQWYNLLQKTDLFNQEPEQPSEVSVSDEADDS